MFNQLQILVLAHSIATWARVTQLHINVEKTKSENQQSCKYVHDN